MLNVTGLTKRFGALRAVNEVSFEVNEGEILGLIGPNGSGKSTTFNCIAGLYPPNAGTITFEGADITGLTPNRVCHKGIGRTFQIPRPFRNLTLVENVALSGPEPLRVEYVNAHGTSTQLNDAGETKAWEEEHVVRYFFPQELDLALRCNGLHLLQLSSFPDGEGPPDERAWNIVGIAQAR